MDRRKASPLGASRSAGHPPLLHPVAACLPLCETVSKRSGSPSIAIRCGRRISGPARRASAIDTCAPTIGATGQCIRLAAEPHGLIFLPQIDFLPTQGASLGRTCTTNQGGIWAAVQFARLAHPDARFLVAPVNLGEADEAALTRQLYRSLREVFHRLRPAGRPGPLPRRLALCR